MDIYPSPAASAHGGLVMEVRDIERFLTEWGKQNRSPQTVGKYRNALMKLYAFLPEDHIVRRDTVYRWREWLLQSGYAPNTVNLHISVCNTWLEFMDRREYQLLGHLSGDGKYRAALTREEYFRLLLEARARGQEKLFLLIKVFGSTGLHASEIPDVTVEAVKAGWLTGRESGGERRICLPEGLKKELLAYAGRESIVAGSLFRTREGGALACTAMATQICSLGKELGIADGKATPSGLRLMYLANCAEIEADAARMVERTLQRQAAQEQLIVGWTA